MQTFTAFVQGSDGKGTIWIGAIEAPDVDAAIDAACSECADAWECSPDDVHCLGIAAGDVSILHWQDLNDD